MVKQNIRHFLKLGRAESRGRDECDTRSVLGEVEVDGSAGAHASW